MTSTSTSSICGPDAQVACSCSTTRPGLGIRRFPSWIEQLAEPRLVVARRRSLPGSGGDAAVIPLVRQVDIDLVELHARVTIELDLLIDEFAAVLEGYLTRAQLLDVLV